MSILMAMRFLLTVVAILTLAVLPVLTVYGQEETGEATVEEAPQLTPITDVKTYKSWEFGCSLTAPVGWELKTGVPGALAKIIDPTKEAYLSLSANLLAEIIPLTDYRVRMERSKELYDLGGRSLKQLVEADRNLAEDVEPFFSPETLSLYESVLHDDSLSAEELALIRAEQLGDEGESYDIGPLQTMGTYLYDEVDASAGKSQRTIGIYCVRGNVGYTIIATAPGEKFDSFLPAFKEVIEEIDLRNLTGGRYAVPEPIKIETEKVGLIMGKVLKNGLGVAGVDVKLYRSVGDFKNDSPMVVVTSNSYGEFLFMNLPPGSGFLLDAEGNMEGTYVRAWQPISKLEVTEGRATMVNIEVVE